MKLIPRSSLGRFGALLLAISLFVPGQAQAGLEPISMQWTEGEWTTSEAPFARTRAEVDRELAASKDALATVRKYQAQANAKPSHALEQFRWAYALVVARFPARQQMTMRSRFRNSRIALAKAPDPLNAEYARIRFLIESYIYPPMETIPALIKVGRRLSARNPGDRSVNYSLASLSRLSTDPRDRDTAVTLARRLLEGHEDSFPLLKLMASSHRRRFDVRKLSKDRDQAIVYYRKMLNLTPSGHPERRMIEGEIRYLQGIKS